jgi:hypothetical protein
VLAAKLDNYAPSSWAWIHVHSGIIYAADFKAFLAPISNSIYENNSSSFGVLDSVGNADTLMVQVLLATRRALHASIAAKNRKIRQVSGSQ